MDHCGEFRQFDIEHCKAIMQLSIFCQKWKLFVKSEDDPSKLQDRLPGASVW